MAFACQHRCRHAPSESPYSSQAHAAAAESLRAVADAELLPDGSAQA